MVLRKEGKRELKKKRASVLLLLAAPCTAACQASLSFKFMSIESVMLSNHLILCCPLLLSSKDELQLVKFKGLKG